MTPRFVFHPAAVDDLHDARDWYEQQQQGLGDELGDVIDAALQRIAENPRLYPEVRSGIGRCVLTRFPFGVFYRLREQRVEVLAVFHHRRDPIVWQRRAAV